jgi:hypothetical protein
VYKIAYKVLSNWLKVILREIISLNQSASVHGRLTTDNVLAYEMTYFMKTKKRRLDGYAAVKLDRSKAYDRVEWSFLLEKMLFKLGFHAGWIQVIMNCISTVTYCIKVNGELTEEIYLHMDSDKVTPFFPTFF